MAERFVELLYKIADGKEFVHIDLTSEDARELIYEVYGGKETLRTEYPYTNKAFSRAASTPAGQTSMPKMAQDYEHDPIGQFADGVALDIFGMFMVSCLTIFILSQLRFVYHLLARFRVTQRRLFLATYIPLMAKFL